MTFKGVIEMGGRSWLTTFLALVALSAGTFMAPGAASAAGKIKVVQSVGLAASAADVWKVVGAFDKLQDWHPAVESSTMNGSPTAKGSHRVLHLKGGGDIEEMLTSYSAKKMRLNYSIVSSPLPVANYKSYMSVKDSGDGHSVMTWGSTFDAAAGATDDKAKETIAGIYKAGLDNLVTKFGAAPKPMKKSHKKKM